MLVKDLGSLTLQLEIDRSVLLIRPAASPEFFKMFPVDP
jgi:hypothetical protein